MKNTAGVAHTVLEQLAGTPLPDWDRLQQSVRSVRLRPGEFLFRAGECQPYVFFIEQGVAKMVYETVDGKQWVKGFAAEGAFFASLNALQPNGRASFSVVAVSELVVERLDYAPIKALAEVYMAWQRVLSRAFEIYGFRKEKRERDLLTLSPEERYKNFLAENPALESRISQKDLAGYIRVTPVALSRIKARMAKGAQRSLNLAQTPAQTQTQSPSPSPSRPHPT